MTLDEAREYIGQPVIYERLGDEPRRGMITGVGNVSVFVQYADAQDETATRPSDLQLDTATSQNRR